MESLMYKTPSPVTAKRRLSGIPVPRSPAGRGDRVASEQVQRIQREWPGLHDERSRRDSLGSRNDLLTTLREEADTADSSMGFRELERHIAKIKRQNFDLKLELHIRREKMTANAEKIHRAERMIQENDELRETLRETRLFLQTRDEELSDCKALIRLLSDQLEQAHKRIAALTDVPPSIQTTTSPTQSDVESLKDTPMLDDSEFAPSPGGSPGSLLSLESNFASDSDEEMESHSVVMKVKEQPTTAVTRVDSLRTIRIPRQLEHVPKNIRRNSMLVLDEISPREPYHSERPQSQIPTKRKPVSLDLQPSRRKSQLVTPTVSRSKPDVPAVQLPPTPEDTPIPVKVPAQQRAPLTLKGRIFRSKSDLQDQPKSESDVPSEPIVKKKTSFIRFWKKSPPASKKEPTAKPLTTKANTTAYPSPQPTPPQEPKFTAPHESDKLSRYPKVRPSSLATTRSVATGTTNPEWRQSVGRQVAEMVQHWEEETNKRIPGNMVSCAGCVASKRHSTPPGTIVKDVSSSLAVKAARDAWGMKASTVSRAQSLRVAERERVERIGKLSSKRDELVRKMGVREVGV